ncbi:hypothetical protein HKD37_12G034412 [Glycine soja]
MLHSHHHHLLFSTFPIPLSLSTITYHHPSLPSLHFLQRPITSTITITTTVSAIPFIVAWLAKLTTQGFGPFELPFFSPSSLLLLNDPSTLQVASNVLFSGAITVFFHSIQHHTKCAKELPFLKFQALSPSPTATISHHKSSLSSIETPHREEPFNQSGIFQLGLRSSGVKKSLNNLKPMSSSYIKAKSPPSPDQALFTTSIEASLGRQALSDNFSVRQITITIRTIINGLCYLATFVYGINSVGLFLYSGQLAIDTTGRGSSGKETESKITQQPGLSNASVDNNNNNNNKLSSTKEDQSSNNSL